ncbi:glucosamine-6-phosphate deaminase [candidate division KSB1 bacterium 4484_87]|nr:MAG: glucosamine-6-phosphate deaminase [candidate division KSB1 bacterium 4484_87]
MTHSANFIFDESNVEKEALAKSELDAIYSPTEKIPVIIVENFPALGKLTAVRFLEWVQNHPNGVISLPTGKTPEHFIKWVKYFLKNWDKKDVKEDLRNWGLLDTNKRPEMKNLRFVQIDEFYPINPQQYNSFYHYINRFYIKEFGLDKSKALLIDAFKIGVPGELDPVRVFPEDKVDLSLRYRQPTLKTERIQKQVIEAVDQYCFEYETKIREMGGIGFFLGGIGPDGHIAFNVRGSDHYSTTRLTLTNYETQAAAASDMGGIEIARNRLVITIGLSTITYNPDAVAIIIAAGEAKAKIVQQAIENEPSNLYPATVLQQLPRARFYLTRGASKYLVERRYQELARKEDVSTEDIERITINLAQLNAKRLHELTNKHFSENKIGNLLISKTDKSIADIIELTGDSIKHKIEDGLAPVSNEVFMHTAPHHDDIMLGFWPYMVHLVRDPQNKHFFNYMTSGFTAVTNKYVFELLTILRENHIDTAQFNRLHDQNYFDFNNALFRDRDVYHYLDGIAAHSRSIKNEAQSRRLLRNLMFIFEEESLEHIKHRIDELLNYFRTQYPGKKDLTYIQQLKGMIREWEADLLWAYLGFNSRNVNHLRLGFYKGEIFTEEPDIQRDVAPILKLIEEIRPTIVTVALDPEGSGPDTHYKVLQAISTALKHYVEKHKKLKNKISIWGYRNVWYRFHPSEATTFVPVSLNSFASLDQAFLSCFGSQRSASFPSYELDGPFSRLAQQIMVEQYQLIKSALGREFLFENKHPRLRAARGFNFLKKMTLDEFFQHSEELRKKTEE